MFLQAKQLLRAEAPYNWNVGQLRQLCADQVKSGVIGELYDSLGRLFERVRPSLPKQRQVRYNSVDVNVFERPLDWLFPAVSWRARDKPQYDSGTVDGIRDHVTEGDMVVIIGGGFGVTTVAAARQVGESGTVLTYEAAEERVRDVRKAAEYDGVSDRVSVLHALIERVDKAIGEVGGAPTVPARALPPCDVLVLDCDGPEARILRDLSIEPRVILANTAGRFGSPEAAVQEALTDLGYRVISREVLSEGSREFCHEHGYYTLTAVREECTQEWNVDRAPGAEGGEPAGQASSPGAGSEVPSTSS